MKRFLFLLVIAGSYGVLSFEKLTPCVRTSPEFDVCMKKILQSLVPKISHSGLPELGLEKLDPLSVPEMVFNYESLLDIGGKMVVKNTTVKGISNIKISKVRSIIVDKNLFSMNIDFSIPKMAFEGNFSMNGRVSLFPVSGGGPYNISTGEVKGVWRVRGVPVSIGGVKYLRLTKFGMEPTLSKFHLHAENLVKGNPKLSRMVLAFTNRFWSLLYYQTFPYFEKNFDDLGKNLLNKMLLSVPYDVLFPLV